MKGCDYKKLIFIINNIIRCIYLCFNPKNMVNHFSNFRKS